MPVTIILKITGCEFIENDCGYGGGAVSCYIVYGTKMTNCLFTDNYTMFSNGGAINTLGSGNTIYLANCTITGNTAVTGDGGAIDLAYGTAYIANTIVFDNPGMYSDDIYLDWGGYAEIHCCNMPFPAGATGSNNIDEDPLFADAGNGDFQLTENSPCRDTATAYIVLGGETLVDLSPDQYCGSAPDMGAYEYCTATVAAVLGCIPSSGTLPFTVQMNVRLENRYNGHSRRMAARIDATLASGTFFSSWRAGSTNIAANSNYVTAWNQNFPALGTLVGENQFTLLAEDVTPAPYNQPPYPTSGDTASDGCTVEGLAP